ncbi:MAG: methyltransferase domain-containing protein [Pseudomonadota bacterium]
MSHADAQPDWNKIAEKFDLWLPYLAPVGEALLDALQARLGEVILDVASGTGEPALSLARRLRGNLMLQGVDAAKGMVKVAQAKARQEGWSNLRFSCMPAERLSFPAHHFDRALCRFGVMLFEHPQKGLEEILRVLKPGGRVALAVWGPPASMTTLYWAHLALRDRLPEDQQPPIGKVTSLGAPGMLQSLLETAGFTRCTVQYFDFHYRFSSFAEYWRLVEASDIMKMQFDALPIGELTAVREQIAMYAQAYAHEGQLIIPHQAVLATAYKPA